MKRALAAAVLLSGCLGTETGNPPFAPSIGSDTGAPMGVMPNVEIEGGWLVIAELALEDCAGRSTVVREAPLALELLGDQRVGTAAVLDEGEYCAVHFSRVVRSEAAPQELSGRSFALDGTFSATPVRIRSARVGSVALVSEEGFEMSADIGGLLIFLDESLLFNGVAFESAEEEADGSILVSEDRNAELLDTIEDQLPRGLFVYRDDDRDGRLSADERAAGPLASAPP